jgi:D-glycero-D-manno-heptose 1,7-bisphosphate phosphatase
MTTEGRQAVFLDRDGTLISDPGYLRDPVQVELLPGAAAALTALAQRGYLLVLVSNQSGIGRGLITAQEAHSVHRRVVAVLAQAGIALDAAYYCPHAPDDACSCRKPRAGLLFDAAREHGIDLHRSIMIGNSPSDVGAGKEAGTFTIFLRDGGSTANQVDADAVASSWDEAREIVIAATGDRALRS